MPLFVPPLTLDRDYDQFHETHNVLDEIGKIVGRIEIEYDRYSAFVYSDENGWTDSECVYTDEIPGRHNMTEYEQAAHLVNALDAIWAKLKEQPASGETITLKTSEFLPMLDKAERFQNETPSDDSERYLSRISELKAQAEGEDEITLEQDEFSTIFSFAFVHNNRRDVSH